MKKKYWIGPLAATMALAGAGAVSAQQPCSDSSSSAPGCTVDVRPVALNPSPATPSLSPTSVSPTTKVAGRQQLPVTGGEVATLVAVGSGMLVGGTLMVRRSRASATSA